MQCIETETEMKVTVKKELYFTKQAWDSLKEKCIENCWIHTGILP